jgi:hypothetical protein
MIDPHAGTTPPTSAKAPEESQAQTSEPVPTAQPELSKLTTDAMDYWRDFAQRSVLFMDILRRSGNQYEEMRAHTINSVLIYDFDYVLRGDALPRPVNYALVRIVPPAGVELDERKRPVVVIDPRAGQGPGIGGFKPVSEIGDAFKFGHQSISSASLRSRWTASASRTWRVRTPSSSKRCATCIPTHPAGLSSSEIVRPAGTR